MLLHVSHLHGDPTTCDVSKLWPMRPKIGGFTPLVNGVDADLANKCAETECLNPEFFIRLDANKVAAHSEPSYS